MFDGPIIIHVSKAALFKILGENLDKQFNTYAATDHSVVTHLEEDTDKDEKDAPSYKIVFERRPKEPK